MSNKCPCGKKKSGLFIHCFNAECEVGWWHTACCGFNKDITKKQLDSIGHWNCPCCVITAIQIPGYNLYNSNTLVSKMEEQIDNLKCEIADLKDVKQSLADIGKEQTKTKELWSDIVGNISNDKNSFASTLAREVVDHSAKVVSDRESRENNVIIFNAKECGSEEASERQQHDQNIFDGICNVTMSSRVPVGKISRIGKRPSKRTAVEPEAVVETEGDAEIISQNQVGMKPRPIKVCFSNSFDKRKFLASLSKLKEAPADFKNVRVQHDLSPEERKKTKDLLAEAYIIKTKQNHLLVFCTR